MIPAMVTALVLAQATSSHSSPVIESDSSCPSAEAVREALVGLTPAEGWPSTTVSIAAQEQALLLSLGVHATNQRRLTVEADCGARASMAALVIAAWLSELPSEAVAPPTLRAQEPAAPAEAVRSAPEPGRAALPVYRREIGAGLLAQTGSGLSPGLRLELLGHLVARPFGWQVSLVLPPARDVTVGAGRTSFKRTSAAASLFGRFVVRRLILSADAGAALAYTSAQGIGYEENQTDQSLTYGIGAGLRAGASWGRVRIWIDGRFLKWLYGQTVEVEGLASTAALPAWDLQGAIGAGYAF